MAIQREIETQRKELQRKEGNMDDLTGRRVEDPAFSSVRISVVSVEDRTSMWRTARIRFLFENPKEGVTDNGPLNCTTR